MHKILKHLFGLAGVFLLVHETEWQQWNSRGTLPFLLIGTLIVALWAYWYQEDGFFRESSTSQRQRKP